MIQTNIASKTQRHVVRRPVFVSSEDVVQKRRGPDHQPVMPQADVLTLYSPPQRNTSTVPPNEYEVIGFACLVGVSFKGGKMLYSKYVGLLLE